MLTQPVTPELSNHASSGAYIGLGEGVFWKRGHSKRVRVLENVARDFRKPTELEKIKQNPTNSPGLQGSSDLVEILEILP